MSLNMSAQFPSEKLQKLRQTQSEATGKAQCLAEIELGRYFRLNIHHPDSAIYHLNEALACARNIRDTKLEINVLQRMANHHAKYGKEQLALALINKSIGKADSLGLKTRSVTNRIKAHCHSVLNQKDSAYFYYKKELQISKDSPIEVLYTCQYLVELLCRMKLYEEAEEYILLGVAQKERVSSIDYMVFLQSAVDYYSSCNPNSKEFVKYELEALDLGKTFGGFDESYHSESVVLDGRELSERKELFRAAINEMSAQNHTDGVKKMYFRLIYLLKNAKSNREAEAATLECLSWLDEKDHVDPDTRSVLWKILYDIYSEEENSISALRALESYHQMIDSSNKLTHTEQVREIEAKYKTAKKEKLIAEQQLEIDNKRNAIKLISLGAAIFFILGYFLWWNQRQKSRLLERDRELQARKIEDLEKEKKIVSLSSMIDGQEAERDRISKDLHDGLGSLLSATKAHYSRLGHGIDNQESSEVHKKANELMDSACEELRRISHNLMPPILRNQGLIPAVSAFIAQYQEAHSIRVEYEVRDMAGQLEQTQQVFLFRIIQELFQNIKKHAKASVIELSIYGLGENIQIIVEDDGIGYKVEDKEQGIGMHSISSRVYYMGGTYEIDSVKGRGTMVVINVPASHIIG